MKVFSLDFPLAPSHKPEERKNIDGPMAYSLEKVL